ncbi:LytR/AlgR family response regulator transcription factor [Tenuifilum thalassicum]|uniref:Response regulator transcription factor n=1 Tax=Tenuifilum thalassicum TaxID=2590900 RepID=A0A7D3XEM3_9BACT|nr:LytTR family DNA-binding domain-containing protein [Tenuifilum thalassicum]QKG80372.1 response regulator transcription factor [Tenuifilum thalassicum]
MQYIIVEDEQPTAEMLKGLVESLRPNFKCLGCFDSVSSTVRWLQTNEHPDIAFFDIQLADGLSFEIFEHLKLNCPVIFTTAFNEYAIKAFKVNSIDYLLKPINKVDLKSALEKFESMQRPALVTPELLASIAAQLGAPNFRRRFIVRVGEHIKTIETENVVLFHVMEKNTYLKTADGRDYAIDFTLEMLEVELDPVQFFRINRGAIVSKKFIRDIVVYSSSRLKVITPIENDEPLIVSRERVSDFKKWLEK